MEISLSTNQGCYLIEVDKDYQGTLKAQGMPTFHITQVLKHPTQGFLAATQGRGVFYSQDYLEWHPFLTHPSKNHVSCLAFSRQEPYSVLLALVSAELLEWSPLENSWKQHPGLHQHPQAESWTNHLPPYQPYISSLAFHPKHPQTVFAGIFCGGVWGCPKLSESDWQPRYSFPLKHCTGLSFHPNNNQNLLASSSDGLWLTQNLGGEWFNLSHQLPIREIKAFNWHRDNPKYIAVIAENRASGKNQVFFSIDQAKSWHTTPSASSIESLSDAPGGWLFGTEKGELLFLGFGQNYFHRLFTLPGRKIRHIHAIL